jgi:hypothetical protein
VQDGAVNLNLSEGLTVTPVQPVATQARTNCYFWGSLILEALKWIRTLGGLMAP